MGKSFEAAHHHVAKGWVFVTLQLAGESEITGQFKKNFGYCCCVLCHEGLEPNFPGCEVNDKQKEQHVGMVRMSQPQRLWWAS